MNRQHFLITAVLVGFMLLLVACPDFGFAYRMQIQVRNGSNDTNTECSGGLQATFQAGSINIQSPKVTPQKFFDETIDSLPNGVGVGTPITLEAWCYDVDSSKPTGYIKIEQPWQLNSVNSLSIFPPSPGKDTCIKGTKETSPVPCVLGPMFK